MHGHRIGDLRYADDTVLLLHSETGLPKLIESVKHPSGTKVMKTDKADNTPVIYMSMVKV